MSSAHRFLSPLLGVVLSTAAAVAQPPPSPTPVGEPAAGEPAAAQVQAPTAVAPAAPLALALEGPMALVFHTVKGDRGADFEQLFTRLQAGLGASSNEARRQQGAGWRLVKQNAPTAEGHLLYVSVIQPVVAGEEYDMARLLAEAFPDEGLALYQMLIAVHVQPTVQASNLTPVAAAGAQP